MKNILILGAASDIGKNLAYIFARNGFNLTLAVRRTDELASLASDIQIRHKISVVIVNFDALDYASHLNFYEELPVKPDVVICIFGYLGDQKKAEQNFAEAAQILHSNFTGAVSILSIVANDFEARRVGSIIGISSVAGERGRQSNYFYGSAKSGFTAFLSGLRGRMWKSGVSVLTVKPGFVQTKMVAHLKLPPFITGKPERVAEDIFSAWEKGKDILYTPKIWRLIMALVRAVPEGIFKKLNV